MQPGDHVRLERARRLPQTRAADANVVCQGMTAIALISIR
jgi:hypothetical protein